MKELTILLMKKIFKLGDEKRLKVEQKPQNVEVEYDIPYCEDDNALHKFDLLTKSGEKKKNPTVFHIHGGGFIAGDKSIYDNYCRRIAQKGFTVVNINYSLAPKNPFPSALQDLLMAIDFALANADRFYIDTEKLFLVGDSAGANLAAMLALSNISKNVEYTIGGKLSFKPTAVALSCGVYMLEKSKTRKGLSKMDMKKMYFQRRENENPPVESYGIYENLNKDFPPCFLTSCADDFMNADNVLFRQTLEKLGVKTEALFFDKTHNPLGHVYNYRYVTNDGKEMPEAKLCLDKMTEFFKSI